MKKQKLNFKDIAKVLNREEMRKIMAGSGGETCNTGSVCNLPDKYVPCCHMCTPVYGNATNTIYVCQ